MALAVLVQGGYVSASTVSCHSEGTQRVVLENDGCCESERQEPAHCLMDRCCDIEVSTNLIFAHHRDSKVEEEDGAKEVYADLPAHFATAFARPHAGDRHAGPAPPLLDLSVDLLIHYCIYRL